VKELAVEFYGMNRGWAREYAALEERVNQLERERDEYAERLQYVRERRDQLEQALRAIAHPRWSSPGYARVLAQEALSAAGEGAE
jgi:hypothetical protein